MPPYTVIVLKSARDQLVDLHIKNRKPGKWARIAFADYKICRALEKNPQGGQPVGGSHLLSVVVRPLQATYEIVGQEVTILRYDEMP